VTETAHRTGLIARAGRELGAQIEGLVGALPGGTGYAARRAFHRRRLKALGANPILGRDLLVIGPANILIGDRFSCWRFCTLAACDDGAIVLGDRVSFNSGVYVNACSGGRIEIGNDVMVGPHTVMRTSDHVTAKRDRPMNRQGHHSATIVIESDVWIAANVTLLGGTRIGAGAVVAAGAVVTRDVEPYTIVGGVPARVIKMRADAPVTS
jgi:galactoside O-acetyltransferase